LTLAPLRRGFLLPASLGGAFRCPSWPELVTNGAALHSDPQADGDARPRSRPEPARGPLIYSSPDSVDGNNQYPCEERSNARCSSKERGEISRVRQTVLDCSGVRAVWLNATPDGLQAISLDCGVLGYRGRSKHPRRPRQQVGHSITAFASDIAAHLVPDVRIRVRPDVLATDNHVVGRRSDG
jgi:hypothetical protein